MNEIKLTQFSPGAGCGCKIAPNELKKIVEKSKSSKEFENLLVGNSESDDAAVVDLGDGRAIITTTDFFTPIVDDPYHFGRVAATNAISDIYAMGGSPIVAISILGWPLERLSSDIASEVIRGAKDLCDVANIPLAGGHSISSADPIFGLAVTGIVEKSRIKTNSGATEGSLLFLTKPLGIGVITTAEKFGMASESEKSAALKWMTTLNSIGATLSPLKSLKAMTDVTGFGLMGHALEMAEGSNLQIVIEYNRVPKIEGVESLIERGALPGGTGRNFASYGEKISKLTNLQRGLLCDPQTSGGLLLSVEKEGVEELLTIAKREGVELFEIGHFREAKGDHFIEII